MNTKKPILFHDPKIEPPTQELVEVTVEFTKNELRVIDEAVRAGGYGSRDEFFRGRYCSGHPFISQEEPIDSPHVLASTRLALLRVSQAELLVGLIGI
jgi:hypothetical protein